MDQQEVNEYLNRLLAGKEIPKGELEQVSFESFKKVNAEAVQMQNRLSGLKEEIEDLKIRIHQANGQRQAFANLLVSAETSRRMKPGLGIENDIEKREPGQ